MGIISFLTALFGLPSALNAILARIGSLEAKLSEMEKEKNDARIDQVVKDATLNDASKTSSDISAVLHGLE